MQALGKPQTSLAWLLRAYCGVEAEKALRVADWRRRPLPPPLVRYARTDVHFLPYIAECLR